ncbi:MAG: ABC transporter ATP-binding protein, partial [Candidatus Limnocylindria bacterium]
THDQVEAMTMGDRIAVMRDGILQQTGTPQELYDSPKNVFVAGFIGSPAMNFATTTYADGALQLGNTRIALVGKPAQIASQRPAGSSLLVGFRPEHLDIASATGTEGQIRFPARVDVVEYLGNEELLHAQMEGIEVVAVVPSERQVKAGDNVELTVPAEKLHLFDPETEDCLTS